MKVYFECMLDIPCDYSDSVFVCAGAPIDSTANLLEDNSVSACLFLVSHPASFLKIIQSHKNAVFSRAFGGKALRTCS